MRPIFEILIPLRAVSKKNSQRILTNKRTGKPFIAQSKKAIEFQKATKMMVRAAFDIRNKVDCPVIFDCVASFKIPQYGDNKKQSAGSPCMLTPDISNILNMLHDVCEGIVYTDDKQIVDGVCKKVWGTCDQIHIKIYKDNV